MKTEIELSERLRKACVEKGITEPGFVAQDENGHWYHYTRKPWKGLQSWRGVCHNDENDELLIWSLSENENWHETLMQFVTPKIEAGKRYWRRDGSVSGWLEKSRIANCLFCPNCGVNYWMDGIAYAPHKDKPHDLDLIAEYREESITEWAERNKNIVVDAEAYFVPDIATRDEFMNDQIRPTEP